MSFIGSEIRHTRQACGMAAKTLAEQTGLSKQYVSDVERGRRVPTLSATLTICNLFPDADSAEWLWLLLADRWGPAAVTIMRQQARAALADRQAGTVICQDCGMAHAPEDTAACIEGHGSDPDSDEREE